MADHKWNYLLKVFVLIFLFAFLLSNKCLANQNWQNIDQEVQKKVFQINVGLKIRLQNNLWVQVSDVSSQKKYYVFTTNNKDFGYQVIGRGSSFPIFIDGQNKIFFVTNRHVLDNARQITEECVMFYAASLFYAQNYMAGKNNFQQLLEIINLANKKKRSLAEDKKYKDTINAIWNCYDNRLSERVDPQRLLFNKYKKLVSLEVQSSYFIHGRGPSSQPAMEAKLYKLAKKPEPDLAILMVNSYEGAQSHLVVENYLPLDFDVKEKEEIQIIGYPTLNSQLKEYNPIFSNGKVTHLKKHTFEFQAKLSKGFSGGPVINKNGKTIGIVTQRLLTDEGGISSDQGAAIKSIELKQFMPVTLKGQTKKK